MSDAIKLLTALALTPDGKLDGFIRRHLAGSSGVSEDDLRDAKGLLDAIAAALESPDEPQAWAKLKTARTALETASGIVATDDVEGGGTVALDAPEAGSGALPFSPAQTVAELPEPALGGAYDQSQAGGTIAADAAAPAGGALPFGQHELTLEQYAALCAESARDPSRTAEVNARYGLGAPGARGRVDLAWQKRLAKDPDLRAKWRALFDRLKAGG